MSLEKKLFYNIFEEEFFTECNTRINNENWKDIFENLFFENINSYESFFEKAQIIKILNNVKKYYNHMNDIRYENQLLYEFLKSIPDIKFKLKTRIKSINSIFEKVRKTKAFGKIYDIDALTIILTEYRGKNILNLNDNKQLEIYDYLIKKIDVFYSNLNFYSADYGNNYIKTPKIGKVLDMKVKKQYMFTLNSNEIPRYFSFHKTYENFKSNRIKEIHINTWETEKAIKGNTTLNHYIYKPCKIDEFLIFNVPKHLDILNNHILEYNLIEAFDYNFYNQISFDTYLEKLKYVNTRNNTTKKLPIKQKIKC